MTYNQLEDITEQSSMVTKFTWLVEKTNGESKMVTFCLLLYMFLRYTEIWSDDGGSKSIKLADPKLNSYYYYPELVLVDTEFCVKP